MYIIVLLVMHLFMFRIPSSTADVVGQPVSRIKKGVGKCYLTMSFDTVFDGIPGRYF